jgi:hypothetical protein
LPSGELTGKFSYKQSSDNSPACPELGKTKSGKLFDISTPKPPLDINVAISAVIDQIWHRYDNDGSGELDRDEVKEFVTDTFGEIGQTPA